MSVEVRGIEAARVRKRLPIGYGQLTALETDQPGASKLLQHAIDVHDGQPRRVPKMGLRQGDVVAVFLRQPDLRHADVKLTKQVGDLKDAYNRVVPDLKNFTGWQPHETWQRIPGVLITALLLSLGAPFWFNTVSSLISFKPQTSKQNSSSTQK